MSLTVSGRTLEESTFLRSFECTNKRPLPSGSSKPYKQGRKTNKYKASSLLVHPYEHDRHGSMLVHSYEQGRDQ